MTTHLAPTNGLQRLRCRSLVLLGTVRLSLVFWWQGNPCQKKQNNHCRTKQSWSEKKTIIVEQNNHFRRKKRSLSKHTQKHCRKKILSRKKNNHLWTQNIKNYLSKFLGPRLKNFFLAAAVRTAWKIARHGAFPTRPHVEADGNTAAQR